MKTSIFKQIFAGILAGAALFFFGLFLLRILLVFLIAGAIFRFFIRRRFRRGFAGHRYRFQPVHPGDFNTCNSNGYIIHLRTKKDADIIQLD